MSDVNFEKKLLLALHRCLYQLEKGEDRLSPNGRGELYQLLKIGWSSLEESKQEYILGLIKEEDRVHAERVMETCKERQIKVLSWLDADYPLHALQDPPPIIYVRGAFPDPEKNPYIAIVGARRATGYGREMTEKIVGELEPYGTTIISGLAYGVDAAAHRAAVKFEMPTVAILGCGIDQNYPISHQGLADEVAGVGAVVSEFPWGTPPLKHNFPMRNRVISGLARAVVVIEAAIYSGSRITARWAGEQGREVFAVPGDVGRSMSSGTNLLIKEGAHLLEGGADIAETLRLQRCVNNGDSEKNPGHGPSDDDIKRDILEFVRSGGNDLEKLCRETGLSAKDLLPMITEAQISNTG